MEMEQVIRRKNGEKTRLYQSWLNMKRRCFNHNCPKFKNHGGRGITVCNDWVSDFVKFHDWAISHGYEDNLTLDRKNNDGNYEPDNCTWSTSYQQNINRRNTRHITFSGETKSLSEWSRITGIKPSVLSLRLFTHRWSVERSLSQPVKQKVFWKIKYLGEITSLNEWATETGANYTKLRKILTNELNTRKSITSIVGTREFLWIFVSFSPKTVFLTCEEILKSEG